MIPRADKDSQARSFRWRSAVILTLVVCGAAVLVARAVELQLVEHGFLAKQGDERTMRVVKIAAHRGAITDRYGEPLAISTPVSAYMKALLPTCPFIEPAAKTGMLCAPYPYDSLAWRLA